MMNTAVPFLFRPLPWTAVGAGSAHTSVGQGGYPFHPPTQSSRAPGALSGGAIAAILGALFIFSPLGDSLKNLLGFGNNGYPTKDFDSIPNTTVANRNWQPPANHTGYKPSYAASVYQSQRKLFYADNNGQWHSKYMEALQEAMLRTNSLQEALDWVNTQGYYDRDIKDNPNDPNTEQGFDAILRGIQSIEKTGAFNKADNGNPNKPRFMMFIGSPSKTAQHNEMVATMARAYGLPPENIIFTNGADAASIEAGYAMLKQKVDGSSNPEHAEIATFVMPDHAARTDENIDESQPEGAHTVKFWDGDVNDASNAVTEHQLRDIQQRYMGGKNEIMINDYCRSGAAVA